MHFRMTCLHAAIAAALATTSAIAAPEVNKLAAPNQPAQMMSTEQAFEAEVLEVAKAHKLSPDYARSILNVEAHSAGIVESIRERYKNRLAGIYIEHYPMHRLVVRLTGSDPVPAQSHKFGDDALVVEFQPGAPHTVAELVTALKTATQGDVASIIPGSHGGYVDERTGDLVIEVMPDADGEKAAVAASRSKAQQVLGVPVRIEEAEAAEAQAVFGSGTLGEGCTTGFTVNHAASGLQGVLTAGHCQSASGIDTYTGIDGATATLGQQGWVQNANADLLWYTGTTGETFGPWFYADAWRQTTGRRTQGATTVGASFCHYGKNSGYSCGTIHTVYANPGSICGAPNYNSPCNASFVRVGGTNLRCVEGDSGGPWFTAGTLAAGIHFAGVPSGVGACWYTSTDYAYSDLGLNLLY
ncbi:TPA: S1 family peptidase [Pseudomonas aeruginosa]